jgi:hypothetical protein
MSKESENINERPSYEIGQYLKDYFSSKYIISYEKIDNTTIKIVEKKVFRNEDMDKYSVLM